MKELELKYGCNPNQKPAKIYMAKGGNLPIKVLNGRPGYINLMDAFNSWQLVRELKAATGMVSATSFKHVSPTSAAVGKKLSDTLKKIYFVEDIQGIDDSPIACAYARARGTDRMSSFGDFIALSDTCDSVTANIIKREVSDGIIAPSFTEEALKILSQKKKGNYVVLQMDENYLPDATETKQVFGISFEQARNEIKLDNSVLTNIVSKNKNLPDSAKTDLLIALITLKYTQSNSVCFAKDGQAIGVGAGQQSRIHCTRLAGNKADLWHLRQHEKVMGLNFLENLGRADRDNCIDIFLSNCPEDVIGENVWQNYFASKPQPLTEKEKKEFFSNISDVSLASDAFFPFGDNIERAKKSGVGFVVEGGGSIRDDNVIETSDKYNMVLIFNGIRLFHH